MRHNGKVRIDSTPFQEPEYNIIEWLQRLGDSFEKRDGVIAMATTKPQLLTADDLLRMYSEGVRGELILGVLCETMPAGGRHGEIALTLGAEILSFVRPRRLGRVAGTDTGVRLSRNPDTVREPDLAYFSAQTLPLDERPFGYYEVIPDLVAEVASPNDRPQEVHDKCHMWINAGVPMVLEIQPESRSIRIHRTDQPIVTLTEDNVLDGGDVLPGFSCQVGELFDI